MRILIGIVVAAALGWCGYWFIGAASVEKELAGWIEARKAEGWVAEYQGLDTQGFPNRFDTTFTALNLADPDTGVAWSAPFFQIFALSYKPNHIIAVWPDSQVFATPDERITITAGDMRGSVVFDAGPDLALNRSTVELQEMGFTSSRGWNAALDHGQLAARRADGQDKTYDISFTASDLTPSSDFMRLLEGGDVLPRVVDGMSLDATVTFDAPWDRFAVERERPQIRTLELKLLQADWGHLDLWMAGELTVDGEGVPTGEIMVKAKNWPEMVEIARATGALPEALVSTVTGALKFLSSLSGDPDTLDAPLSMKSGILFLGPIPIGPAPRLVLP